jgi:hypothetical protein
LGAQAKLTHTAREAAIQGDWLREEGGVVFRFQLEAIYSSWLSAHADSPSYYDDRQMDKTVHVA